MANLSAPSTLRSLREIQAYNYPKPTPGATAPDYCLAAARFLCGKLIGLFPRERHLNDFLSSPQAHKLAPEFDVRALKAAWGTLTKLDDFNRTVLPAAITWGGMRPPAGIEFRHLRGNASQADGLMRQRIPLVVGVSLHGTGSRDHFIVLVMGATNAVWAVDSWGDDQGGSVAGLGAAVSFTKGATAEMNAGTTTIPCRMPFFGYFMANGEALQAQIAL